MDNVYSTTGLMDTDLSKGILGDICLHDENGFNAVL